MAGLDAAGAYINLFYLAVVKGSDPLQVGIETAIVEVVSMADIVSNHWFLSAYFTLFGHSYFSLIFLYEILHKSRAYFKLRCGQSRIRIRSAHGSFIKVSFKPEQTF